MDTLAVQAKIVTVAGALGVDPALALAVARQESGFDQSARSPAGAIGVFQLMPRTAAGLGVDPFNADGNIEGGVIYLSQLLARYDGDQALALAAYNAGPGNVSKYGGVPPYPETQSYVSKILAAIGLEWPAASGSGGGGTDNSSGGGGPVTSAFAGLADSLPVEPAALFLAAGTVAGLYLLSRLLSRFL